MNTCGGCKVIFPSFLFRICMGE